MTRAWKVPCLMTRPEAKRYLLRCMARDLGRVVFGQGGYDLETMTDDERGRVESAAAELVREFEGRGRETRPLRLPLRVKGRA